MRTGLGTAFAVVVFIFMFVGTGGHASEPKPSVTPLADTGLWEPPVLTTKQYQYIPIPKDEGLAAFYGRYRPIVDHEIVLFDHLMVSAGEITTYGSPYRGVLDTITEFRLLHQGPNYVFLKSRKFPYREYNQRPDDPPSYEKSISFMVIAFIEETSFPGVPYFMRISKCEGTWLPLFAPDTYGQSPEADAKELAKSWVYKEMRAAFASGSVSCGTTTSYAIDTRS